MLCFPPSAALSKPPLTFHPANPVDGSPMTLFCGPVNPEVTKYEFYKGTQNLPSSNIKNNAYTIKSLKFSDDGEYYCKAYKESFPTQSDKQILQGKLVL